MPTYHQPGMDRPEYGKQPSLTADDDTGGTAPPSILLPAIELPRGGGAIKGIEEKFQVNAVTGTSSLGVPIPTSPNRRGFTPALALTYDSGGGNGPFGLGWEVAIPAVTRKTDQKLPTYQDGREADTFMLAGLDDLVPMLDASAAEDTILRYPRTYRGTAYRVTRYRPRREGAYMRIEKWVADSTGDTFWKTVSIDNVHSYYGLTPASRISDPADATRIYSWCLCLTHDDKGNVAEYVYKQEDFAGVANRLSEKNRRQRCTQTYLKQVRYGNKTPYALGDAPPDVGDYLFQIVFDYGEHDLTLPQDVHLERQPWSVRQDAFSTHRPGFEVRTYRRCGRILLFHCFEAPHLPHTPYLVRSLELIYDDQLHFVGNGRDLEGFSFLTSARQNGHRWDAAAGRYTTKSLPELEFTYAPHQWNTAIQTAATVHTPSGLHDKRYLWTDLFGEGISGILTEQGGAWYYQANQGDGAFGRGAQVAPRPNFSGLATGQLFLQELEGNGTKYLVQLQDEPKGFFKLGLDDEWEPFRPFAANPTVDLLDPNMRPIDLTGDGRADLLFTHVDTMEWYEGIGEEGFRVSAKVFKEIDEEKGPAIVFQNHLTSIFLADMDGDGLTDIVRIQNGEVSYWPNLGYGRFGPKMGMEDAPYFAAPELFSPENLRLADIDGSGTTDLIYLDKDEFTVWMNLNGNGWSLEPQRIAPFPQINAMRDVAVLDFLGTGTACIVYSSSLPEDARQPLQYIDLMGSRKPHLLMSYHNHCGKEIRLEYKTSTHYYLEDQRAGQPWITRLPFPVHCVARVTSEDQIARTIFVNEYRYRHGYFDTQEREFRGFARVEQFDTESFSRFSVHAANNVVEERLHQPPIRTVTWFHTGAYLQGRNLLNQCRREYFQNGQVAEYAMPEPILPAGLAADELREAVRCLKGVPLRREVYQVGDAPADAHPYVVNESNYEIRLIQRKGRRHYAVCEVLPSESIYYAYERNPADPRITHSMFLEIDEVGNATKAVSIVYPRAQRPTGAAAIPDTVWAEQNRAHVDYLEKHYTPDIDEENVYRLRVGFEDVSYEVGNLPVTTGTYLKKRDLLSLLPAAPVIEYHEEFSGGVQKRLTQQNRRYYLNDTLDGGLPLGTPARLGLLHRVQSLAFTAGLVAQGYGAKVDDAMLTAAGYTHSEGDNHWWTVTSTHLYDANPTATFYTPVGARDPFGQVSRVAYDDYFLMTVRSTNALGHVVTAVNDYRTLSAVQVTDANGNRARTATDELGFMVAFAVMGKEGDGTGDTLDDPTTRVTYDLLNWKNHQRPNYVHTFMREEHGAANPRWQEAFYYADGSGNLILVKRQTEPGLARTWDPVTGTVVEAHAASRWIGNGRTIVNNKASIIREFEPYFSATPDYEDEAALVETGISTVYTYDALGRNIRSDNPNGTFSRVEFDTWHFKSYDVNDTVRDSAWYAQRGAPDPNVDPEPADPQVRAAWLAARHHGTPHTIHYDSGSRPMQTVSDFGAGHTLATTFLTDSRERFAHAFDAFAREISQGTVNMIGAPLWSESAEQGEKWILLDVMGNIHRIWVGDDLVFRFAYDPLYRTLANYVTRAGREILYQFNLYGDIYPDAPAHNLVGRLHRVYDSSGEIAYDQVDFKGNALRVRRRLARDYKIEPDWASLAGLTDIGQVDAAVAPLLEPEVLTTTSEVDALNRPKVIVLPDNTRILPTFNEANLLETFGAQLRGSGAAVTFLEAQDYDAKGQRQFARYGNGLITFYEYEPDTYRLSRILTKRAGESDAQSVQNLQYTYDPKGNVVQVRDAAQQTHFFQNAVVAPEYTYAYDALYNLIKATGREHAVMTNNSPRDHLDLAPEPNLPHPNDAGAIRHYIEEYVYDDLGNILSLEHRAGATTWRREYRYGYQDNPADRTNRLLRTNLPGDPPGGPYTGVFKYDAQGNMTRMPHLAQLVWNDNGDLRELDLGGGGRAWYQYTSTGGRIRKVIERAGGRRLERIYLGALEIYREYQGSTKVLERNTLNITDDTGRVAQVDTKLLDTGNSDPDNPLNRDLIRYTYENHLGSATLETNEAGVVIAYEEYYPYGSSAYRVSRSGTNLSLKRYRFSRKERDDESGLYYFGTRYYAAWLGRWISCDRGGRVDTLNLYQYCRNNPVSLRDPNGANGEGEGETKSYNVPRRWRNEQEAREYWEGRIIEWNGQRVRVHVESVTRSASSATGWLISISTTPVDGNPSGADAGSGGTTPSPTPDAGGGSNTPPPSSGPGGSPSGSPNGAPGGAPGGTPGGTPNPQPQPSTTAPPGGGGGTATAPPSSPPAPSPTGSPTGSPNGVPNGSPNGSPNGRPGGSGEGSGGGGGKRSFWSRGGSTLLLGLLLLGAGLLTIFTAGAATPVLVLLSGAMATAGGIALTTTSTIQLTASYAGATTAEQDARVVRGLHTVGALSSPGGLVGGTIGSMVADDPQQGLQTGSLIGGVAELGTGVARFGLARLSGGSVTPLVSGDAAVTTAVGKITPAATAATGTSVLVSHGGVGPGGAIVLTQSGIQPLSSLASVVQSSPHGRSVLLMCSVGQDAAAVQSLANATGRSITAYAGKVSAHTTSLTSVTNAAGVPVSAVTRAPEYLSPYLNLTPNVAAPGAAVSSGATTPSQ